MVVCSILAATAPQAAAQSAEDLEQATRRARELVALGVERGVMDERPILDVAFTCTLKRCDKAHERERFARIMGLKAGGRYSRERVQRAEDRLAKTGLFVSVKTRRELAPCPTPGASPPPPNPAPGKATPSPTLTVTADTRKAIAAMCRPGEQGVRLEVVASGAVLIRRISFDGVDPPPFRDDLNKVLLYRRGQPFRDDKNLNKTQIESLKELYEREGYFDTKIEMIATKAEGGSVVDLKFKIVRGEELKICELGLRGLRELSYAEARELLLSELPFLTRTFEGLSFTVPIWGKQVALFRPGYTTRAFRKGQEKLIREYRRRGYFQARFVDKVVDTKSRPGCAQIALDLSEGPRWQTRFEGNQVIDDEALREVLPFFETGYVDQTGVRQAELRMRALYAARGYPLTKVSGIERRRDRLDRELTFSVEERGKYEISKIVFHRTPARGELPLSDVDRKALSDETLLASMRTRAFGLFETSGYLQMEALLVDLARLEELYRARGFLQVVIDRFEVRRVGDAQIEVHLFIEEGPRSLVKRLHIEGDRVKLPEGRARALLDVTDTPGKRAFVPLKVRADRSRLLQKYASFGHPAAQVVSRCRALGSDGAAGAWEACEQPRLPLGCVSRNVDEQDRQCTFDEQRGVLTCQRLSKAPRCAFEGIQSREVEVAHAIRQGPFVRVGEVLVTGDFITWAPLILQDVPLKEGDPLNVQKLLEGQANLRSLGLFDSVSVEVIGLDEALASSGPDGSAAATLVIAVEESDYQYFDVRFGFQGRDLLEDTTRRLLIMGELEYNNRNLFGYGQRLKPRLLAAVDVLQLGQLGWDSQGLGATLRNATSRVDYLIGAELVYTDPRFMRALAGAQKLNLTISPYFLRDLLGVTNNRLLREEVGLRSELRKELSEFVERLYLTFGVQAKWITTWAEGGPIVGGERLFTPRRTVGKIFGNLTLDRRDSPLNPTRGYSWQLAPQWVSGDALGQAGDAIGDSFFRLTLAGSYYVKGLDHVVLGQSLRFGQILPLYQRDRPVPQDERYILGGVGSLRGFPESGISPRTSTWRDQQVGGELMLNYNLEVRYPMMRATGIWGAMFFDAGLLVDCFDDADNSAAISCYRDAFPSEAPLSKLRTAAGIGLRYLVVDQIPLLLDYAIVLNRRPGESFGNIHFNVGYTF